MSAPATKAFSPAPVMTSARISSSAVHGVQQLRQIRQHLRIQGVQRLRTVDGGHGIWTFFLQQYVRHNGSSLLWQPPPKQRQRHGKKRFLRGVFHPQSMHLLIYLIHYSTFV